MTELDADKAPLSTKNFLAAIRHLAMSILPARVRRAIPVILTIVRSCRTRCHRPSTAKGLASVAPEARTLIAWPTRCAPAMNAPFQALAKTSALP